MTFIERCRTAWKQQDSLLCVGLDPELSRLPTALKGMGSPLDQVRAFCIGVVQATADQACAFKPQIAHFAALGAESVLAEVCHHIKQHHPHHILILDSKRGDIGSTAQHYASEAYDRYLADAVTLNPYMGTDSLQPFLDRTDKGIFVLCRTSNPGGYEFQMQTLASGERLFERVATTAQQKWNTKGQAGLVVGATYPSEVARVRALAPDLPLLVPGIGAQGGDLEATVAAGLTASQTPAGLFINSSRAILYASAGDDWQQAAQNEAHRTRLAIAQAARQRPSA
ncbi:MAG: orotidine-5'-phosphate decarboxylase [Burkholderiaceae bacterium]